MTDEDFICVNRQGRPLVNVAIWNARTVGDLIRRAGILMSTETVAKDGTPVVKSALVKIPGKGVRRFDQDGYERGSIVRGGGFRIVDVSELLQSDEQGLSMSGRQARSL
jgi:hypothetical protein